MSCRAYPKKNNEGNIKNKTNVTGFHRKIRHVSFGWDHHMGVSLNGGTPKTPQNDHF